MANAFSNKGCVITIDTTIANLAALVAFLPSGYVNKLHVKCVKWYSGTTAGHTAVITGLDGDILWAASIIGAGDTVIDSTCRSWPDGFLVPTLASGKLEITLA